MPDVNDIELIREYADGQSETAFGSIVAQHINLVYSVALRYVGNSPDAQDVTQAVFIILAQKAASLRQRTNLTGWLYETTRFTARQLLRTRARQHAREQEAYMQSTLDDSSAEIVWQQIAPFLEEAMTRLNEKERAVLALRFFENKSGAETAALLGIQEWAAHKRATRALEKLRKFFIKRGVTSTTSIIAGAISTNSVQAAPAALAKTVTLMAAAKGAAASASTLTLTKGAVKIMAWSKVKTGIVVGAVILLTGGAGLMTIEIIHSARRAHAPDISGAWEGVASLGNPGAGVGKDDVGKVRLVLRLSRSNGTYVGALDDVDLGRGDIRFKQVAYDYPTLHLEYGEHTYTGKVNANGTEITTRLLDNTLVVLKRTTTPDAVPEPLVENDFAPRADSDLQGYWKGTMGTGPGALPVNFKIAEGADGTFRAEFESVMQGARRQPSTLTYHRPELKLQPMTGFGMFQGTINADGTELTGKWIQGGQSKPAAFKRGDYHTEQEREAQKDYSFVSDSNPAGHWKGILDLKTERLHFNMDIARLPDGSFSAGLTSVDQIANEWPIPASAVRYAAPDFRADWLWLDAAFFGKIKDGRFIGKFSLHRKYFSMTFERTAAR